MIVMFFLLSDVIVIVMNHDDSITSTEDSFAILSYAYSCPNLVRPKSEELISRPFVGEIQFQLVLLKRMGTESAIGCLIFYPPGTFFLPHTCTQHPRGHGRFQKDLFRSRSIGFV